MEITKTERMNFKEKSISLPKFKVEKFEWVIKQTKINILTF